MTRYRAVISKYGDTKYVAFTLHILSALDFVARLRYYGWKVESMKRIVLP